MEPDKKEPNFSELHNLSPAALEDKFSKHPLLLKRLVSKYCDLEADKALLVQQIAEFRLTVGYCEDWFCQHCTLPMMQCVVNHVDGNVQEIQAHQDFGALVQELMAQISQHPELGPSGGRRIKVQLIGTRGNRTLDISSFDLPEQLKEKEIIIDELTATNLQLTNEQVFF